MSDFTGYSERQLIERQRHLTDKMQNLWEKIGPLIEEFELDKAEFVALTEEMSRRGMLGEAQQQSQSGEPT